METYGTKTKVDKLRDLFSKSFKITIARKEPSNRYGRCVRLSSGLILGLLLDKALLFITKGKSALVPFSFTPLLMKKGFVLKEIRFEKEFGKFDKLVNHLCWKDL